MSSFVESDYLRRGVLHLPAAENMDVKECKYRWMTSLEPWLRSAKIDAIAVCCFEFSSLFRVEIFFEKMSILCTEINYIGYLLCHNKHLLKYLKTLCVTLINKSDHF